MKKERLDKILVDLGYFENKSKASAAILAGNVTSAEAGTTHNNDISIATAKTIDNNFFIV